MCEIEAGRKWVSPDGLSQTDMHNKAAHSLKLIMHGCTLSENTP